MKEPKENFSIEPAEIEKAKELLRGMILDLRERVSKPKLPDTGESQLQSNAATSQGTAPLNAANLQQQQQQGGKRRQYTNSESDQAPAAPTLSAPPFIFGNSSPSYETYSYPGKRQITQDDLRIPPRKKLRAECVTPSPPNDTPGSSTSINVNVEIGEQPRQVGNSSESSTLSSHAAFVDHSASQDIVQENVANSTTPHESLKYEEPRAWLQNEDTTQLWWRAFAKLRTCNASASQYLEVAVDSIVDGSTKSLSGSSCVVRAFQNLSKVIATVHEHASLKSTLVVTLIDRFYIIVKAVKTTLSFKTGAIAWVGLCGAMMVY
jgi:hypothetical protein